MEHTFEALFKSTVLEFVEAVDVSLSGAEHEVNSVVVSSDGSHPSFHVADLDWLMGHHW